MTIHARLCLCLSTSIRQDRKSLVAVALVALTSVFFTTKALAQSIDDAQGGAVEVTDQSNPAPAVTPSASGTPRVGRKAAEKYMAPKGAKVGRAASAGSSGPSSSNSSGPDAHYLAIYGGAYVSDNSYKWGNKDNQTGTGQSTVGVTYRVGEWRNSMDLGVRIDYSTYSLDTGRASKLSFLPVVTFPDASSKFPLYFGAGIGLGVFTSQIPNESALSLDYQLILGARFFDVIENTGFFIEAGLKNHLLLLSDGQFNGTFVALGPVFSF